MLENCATGRPASGLEMQMLTDSNLYVDVLDNLNLSSPTGEQQALLCIVQTACILNKSVHVGDVFIPHGIQGQLMPRGHKIKFLVPDYLLQGDQQLHWYQRSYSASGNCSTIHKVLNNPCWES